MSRSSRRLAAPILLMSAIAIAGASLLIPPRPGLAESKEPSNRQTELVQKRLALLEEVQGMAAALFKNGRCEYEEVHIAQAQLLEAQLEAATTDEARIEILERQIAESVIFEEIAKTQHEAARATKIPELQAQADRLAAEIQLEQIRSGDVQKH